MESSIEFIWFESVTFTSLADATPTAKITVNAIKKANDNCFFKIILPP